MRLMGMSLVLYVFGNKPNLYLNWNFDLTTAVEENQSDYTSSWAGQECVCKMLC